MGGRTEQTITAPPRGAGRVLDAAFPYPFKQIVGNNSLGVAWIERQGYVVVNWGTNTGFGSPPAGTQWETYRGRIAFRMTGGPGSGGFYLSGARPAIIFPQNKQGASLYNDDWRCWRLTAILAFDHGIGAGDTGLEVGPSINYDVVTGVPPGFRFGPGSDTTAVWQVRQNGGGPFTINTTVVQNFDIADWHMYELRFIGATANTDAIVKVLFDGQQVRSDAWGAGTLLPGLFNAASGGYLFGVGNRGATGAYVCQCGITLSAASSEGALL